MLHVGTQRLAVGVFDHASAHFATLAAKCADNRRGSLLYLLCLRALLVYRRGRSAGSRCCSLFFPIRIMTWNLLSYIQAPDRIQTYCTTPKTICSPRRAFQSLKPPLFGSNTKH